MKTTIAYILTCMSVVAVGTNDIQVVSTPNYNTQPGIVMIKDVYTRDGQTNMVCDTRTKDGALRIRSQDFYHNGLLVGAYSTNTLYAYSRSSFYSVAGVPYGISLNLDYSNQMTVFITDTNHLVLEMYNSTNGIFYPADSSNIASVVFDK
ncbi:MAG: hypothetical protein WCH99_02970 [Verrucomicrobiota bacterium]